MTEEYSDLLVDSFMIRCTDSTSPEFTRMSKMILAKIRVKRSWTTTHWKRFLTEMGQVITLARSAQGDQALIFAAEWSAISDGRQGTAAANLLSATLVQAVEPNGRITPVRLAGDAAVRRY